MDFGCAALATVALCLSMRPFFFEKRERERQRQRKGGRFGRRKEIFPADIGVEPGSKKEIVTSTPT